MGTAPGAGLVLVVALVWAAGGAVASPVVVNTAEQFVSAIEQGASEIVIDGVVDFSAAHGGTLNALPMVVTGEVRITGREGAAVRALQSGFRLAEIGEGANLHISNLHVVDFATSDSGGALLSHGSRLHVQSVHFIGNQSGGDGGAIHVDGGQLALSDSVFINNQATGRGGAVSMLNARAGGALQRNRFHDNLAGAGCSVSVVTVQGPTVPRFERSIFQGDCAGALVDIDSYWDGPHLTHNTWLVRSGQAIRYAVPTARSSQQLRPFGNLILRTGSNDGMPLCVLPDDSGTNWQAVQTQGRNIVSDTSCRLDHPDDLTEPDPMVVLDDLESPWPRLDGPAANAVALPVSARQPPLSERCGFADAFGLGRPQDSAGDGSFACDLGAVEARRGADIGAPQSGAYFDPDRNGEGWLVEILEDGRAWLSWFTFAGIGDLPILREAQPFWMAGVGRVVGNSVVVESLYTYFGGRFGEQFDAEDVWLFDAMGGMSLVFPDCQADPADPGSVHFVSRQTGLGGARSWSHLRTRAVRLTQLVNCDGQPSGPHSGLSGSFYDPSRNGEGLIVQWLPDGRAFLVWYTFDHEQTHLWLVSADIQLDGQRLTATMMYPESPTYFGPEFDADALAFSPWGTVVLDYLDCDQIVLHYDSLLPGYGSGSHDYQRLTRLAGTSCPFEPEQKHP
ncbi:MAG TPA: hypothetical protein PKZ76_06665 [Xanthomonadaceae bacterium]|nr:hypothetical protein [Xanthomonadaceae bacterium]